MYKSFYNLKSAPFSMSPDPRFLYSTAATREALACLEHGIGSRKGFVVLTGEVGTGKTTLLRSALESLHAGTIHTSFVFNPRLDILDFLEFVLTDFGVPPTTRTKSSMLLQLNRWLIERYGQGDICVIVVDEAQNLSRDMLEEIRLLTNLETSSEKLLQIVLSGQPEFEEQLRQPALRQLRQRVPLWAHTSPLSPADTMAYIVHRLEVSGATTPIFSKESVELVHRYSQGIPRIINLICEHALIFGFVDRVPRVNAAVIRDVVRDLDLTAPDETASPVSKPEPSGIQKTTSSVKQPFPDEGSPIEREPERTIR
jgi:general secretion pathway protein A